MHTITSFLPFFEKGVADMSISYGALGIDPKLFLKNNSVTVFTL
jgi:hypothetical protein